MKNLAQWLVLGVLATGCVEQPPARRAGNTAQTSQREVEEARRRVVSTTAPTPQHALNYNFGGKVTLLGYDISSQDARPGSTLTLTWYWRVDASTGDGWRLFTHLDDATNPRVNKDNEGEVRRAYQPERWRRGEFITDRQTIEIPGDWDAPVVRVHIGLWKGDERLPLTAPAGHTSPDGRALAFTLNTGVGGGSAAPSPAPTPAPAAPAPSAAAPAPSAAH